MPNPNKPDKNDKPETIKPGDILVVPSLQEVRKQKIPGSKKRIEAKLDLLISLVSQILNKETSIMATLDDLLAGVAAESTVIDSVEQLLTNLSAMIAAAGTNPAKLQAVQDAITLNTNRLTAAVVALKKGMKLDKDGKEGGAGFFLAMAHWQLGDKEQARMCYSQAVQWMENNEADDPEELCRFRDEAAALLRLKVPKD